MARFINAKFDLEKKITFSCARMIFLLAASFSIGVLFGIELFLVKNQDFLITQPQVSLLPKPAVSPSPSPTVTPIADNVMDWQTYRNEEYGFEFKYPLNYKINEQKGSIELSTETQKGKWLIEIDFVDSYNLSSKMEVLTFDELAINIIHQYYCIYQIEKYDIACTNNIKKKEFNNKYKIKGFEFNIEEVIEDTYSGGKITRIKEPIFVLDLDKQADSIVKPIAFNFNDRNGVLEEKERNAIIDQILSTFKFIEKDTISPTDLLGYWFTPHAATRNITFLKNNQFQFNDGENPIFTGNFIVNGSAVTLKFNNIKTKDIILKFSQDNNAAYLQNEDGEYFVKQ